MKSIAGAVVGGCILFAWSFLAWTMLPLHEPTMHKIADEDAVISALQPQLNDKAVYFFPKGPGMSENNAATEAWTAKMKRGPTGMIVYNPSGSDPVMPRQMVYGLILDILSAWIVCWFLMRSTAMNSSFMSRVVYCSMFGIFVSVFAHLMSWNWMSFPRDFTTAMVID